MASSVSGALAVGLYSKGQSSVKLTSKKALALYLQRVGGSEVVIAELRLRETAFMAKGREREAQAQARQGTGGAGGGCGGGGGGVTRLWPLETTTAGWSPNIKQRNWLVSAFENGEVPKRRADCQPVVDALASMGAEPEAWQVKNWFKNHKDRKRH